MFTRVLTFSRAKDIDGGITYLRDRAVPRISAQKGYRGITASADRAGQVLGILSLWETEAARDESFAALASARDEALGIIGGELKVESFEQVVAEVLSPPVPGAALLVQRISMDPATVDENLAFFKNEIVPRIKALSGLLGLRNMVNRKTGDGIVGTAWRDEPSMRAAQEAALARRPEGEARGVRFGETSFREILYSDLR
jgi:heme-degrading monooxygenase HmoA